MRATSTADGLTLHGVAGNHTVLLGFSMAKAACAGLMGFAIHRNDPEDHEAGYLKGMKAFAATDPGFPAGSQYSTRDHPIQGFQWADYSVKPGRSYTYTVSALKGPPDALAIAAESRVTVITEPHGGVPHDVYFNRGIAGSQAYVRRFGDVRPDGNPRIMEWLSRGLNEALEAFIASAVPGRHALRIAAYEFNYDPVLQLVKQARDRGVDVKCVYDARRDNPREPNQTAITRVGIDDICIPREEGKSYISHNKFIVKLDNGTPVSVWTGGTNFSEGGIFGQSNVAHVVSQPDVAARFLDYWTLLSQDLPSRPMEAAVERLSPLPATPPAGTIAIFSPRPTIDALDWYADLARAAKDGLMMTFAFGMNDKFKEVFETGTAPYRLAVMEKPAVSRGAAQKHIETAEIARIQTMRQMKENTFAIGAFIRTNKIDGWLKERLTGLNTHVRFIHNKFMLIDPLGDDPIVVCGSANFSKASTVANDENMIVVRGDTSVADIYLGEYMRLFSHHAFRESLAWRKPGEAPKPLQDPQAGDTPWWSAHFGDTPRAIRRRFFARVAV